MSTSQPGPPDPEPGSPASLTAWWRRRSRWQQLGIALAGVVVVANVVPDSSPAEVGIVAAATTIAAPTSTVADIVTTTTSVPTTTHPTTTTPTAPTTSTTGTPSTTTSTPATTPPPTTTTPTDSVTVVAVVDGDTIEVRFGGATESLRLIGINSPEGGECYSNEAGARLADLVAGQTVRLVSDRSDRDQYGRLLRYVYVGELFVNEVLVREGYAIARRYEPDTAMATVLEAAQADARSAAAGLWAAEACGAPADANLRIGVIHYDADGNDNENLNDEWVEFVNDGGSEADLTGWVVKDETASHRYPFPTGFVLEAGATVRLHTGCGTDGDAALYWCNQGSAIWNNSGGDTVFLLDPNGNIAVSQRYES